MAGKLITLACAGLVTDPNPLLAARAGALRVADHVVVYAPGVIGLRPSFQDYVEQTTSYRPRALVVFNGTLFISSFDGATWRLERVSGGLNVISGDVTPPSVNESPMQFCEARKSLYHTTSLGIRKLTSGIVSANGLCGVEMAASSFGGSAGSATGPLQGAASWAYRFVFVSKDANNYTRRSPPSASIPGSYGVAGTFFIPWSSGAAGLNRIFIPNWIAAGDQIELYRTRTVSGATSATPLEYYLQQTITVVAADVTNGYVIPQDDRTPDDALGAALYSNPSQLGIAGSKEPPPKAVALAQFGGCMWYGNTTSRHRVQLSIMRTGDTNGWNIEAEAGNVTLGNNQITNVASITGIHVGMYVFDAAAGPVNAGTNIPALTTITTISGAGPYTLTMSANSLATNAGVVLSFCDSIVVGGVRFFASGAGQAYVPGYSLNFDRGVFTGTLGTETTERNLTDTAYGLAHAINVYATLNESTFKIRAVALGNMSNPIGSANPGSIVIEEIGVGGSSFTVQDSAMGTAWSPTITSAVTSTSDVNPNRLYWSDPDEPESVPIGQFVDIGNPRDAILALVPLRACLLVFKTDGIFRVTGIAPDSWQVELLDTSQRLYRGSCVDVLDNVAYALTDRGVIAVDETSVVNITDGAIARELQASTSLLDANTDTVGAFVEAWQGNNLVIVGVPQGAASAIAGAMYVYSATARAWTRWPWPSTAVHADKRSFAIYFAKANAFDVRYTPSAGYDTSSSYGADALISLSGWTYTAGSTTITISDAQRGRWTPAEGDWVAVTIDGTVYYRRVTAATDTGAAYDITIDSALPAGTQSDRQAYEGVLAAVEWQGHSADPASSMLVRETQLLMEWTGATPSFADGRFDVGGNTDVNAETLVSVARTRTEPLRSKILRAYQPRDIARCAHIWPRFEGSNLYLPWLCRGVGLVIEPVSERDAR